MNPPEPTPPDAAVSWWFYADANNKAAGPVTLDQLRQMLADGVITASTHVTEPGEGNWQKLSEIIPGTSAPAPPPLPPHAAFTAPSVSVVATPPSLANARSGLNEAVAKATKDWRAFAEVSPAPTSRPWYNRTGIILASSVFCFPISLALIWTSKRFKPAAQGALTVVCLFIIPFFTLVFFVAIKAPSAAESQRSWVDESQASETTDTAKVEAVMLDIYGKNFRKAEVHHVNGGGCSVNVTFNADGLWSASSSRREIENEMVRAYKAIFAKQDGGAFRNKSDLSGLHAVEVIVTAVSTLQDQYGKETQGEVYVTRMTREVGNRVQWSKSSSLNFSQIWELRDLHPSLQ